MSFGDRLNGMVKLSSKMVLRIKKLQERLWNKYEDDYRIVVFCGYSWFRWLSKKGLEITPRLLLLIPNLISLTRLLILPIFLMGWILSVPQWFYPVVYLLLMLLDLVDGLVARQCGLGSLLGKALDPLADKVAHLSILLVAVLLNLVPIWLLAVLFLKETVLFFFSPRYKKTGAKWWGKVGTLTEVMAFLGVFLFPLPTWIFIVLAMSQIAILLAYVISGKDD